MSKYVIWEQDDFSGGENTSVQPWQVGENEVCLIENMLPSRNDNTLNIRSGVRNIAKFDGVGDILFPFVMRTTAKVDYVLGFNRTQSGYALCRYAAIGRNSAPLTLGVFSTINDASWTQWDRNSCILASPDIGLYVVNVITGSISRIYDYADGTTVVRSGPRGVYPVVHKGRLVVASYSDNGSLSTISYSSSRDDIPGAGRHFRWSGTTASSGGSFDIPPYSSDIVGLCSTGPGLLVFKEDGVYLHTYPDVAAPWNAADGAMVDVVMTGIRCIAHKSIVVSNDVVYFLASDGESICLYSYSSGQLQRISAQSPLIMRGVIPSGVSAAIVDGYYIFVAKDRSSGKHALIAGCDTTSGAWFRFNGIEANAICPAPDDRAIVAMNGAIGIYPSGDYYDIDGKDIEFKVKFRMLLPERNVFDSYYRSALVDVDSNSGFDMTMSTTDVYGNTEDVDTEIVPIDNTHVWGASNPLRWGSARWVSMKKSRGIEYAIDSRMRGCSVTVSGKTNGMLNIKSISVKFRRIRQVSRDVENTVSY